MARNKQNKTLTVAELIDALQKFDGKLLVDIQEYFTGEFYKIDKVTSDENGVFLVAVELRG